VPALAADPTIRRQVGPVFFHPMTRPAIDRIVGMPLGPEEAVDQLVAASLAGLRP
jgi:hypothetical protein